MNEFFKNADAKPKTSWIQENLSKGITADELQTFFLQEELSVTSDSCFDPNLKDRKDFILKSNILIQINEIVDISLPLSSRCLLDVNKNESRRTFKCILSDGYCQYVGVSKTSFPFFHPQILPGVKIKLLKGTKVKYGVFLLEAEKLHILGGLSSNLQKRRQSIIIHDDQKFSHQTYVIPDHSINNEVPIPKRCRRNNSKSQLIISNDSTNVQLVSNDPPPSNDNDQKPDSNLKFLTDSISSDSDIELIESIKPKETKQQQSFLSDDDFSDFEIILSTPKVKRPQFVTFNESQQMTNEIKQTKDKLISEENNHIESQSKKLVSLIDDQNENYGMISSNEKQQNKMISQSDSHKNESISAQDITSKKQNSELKSSDFFNHMKIWEIKDLFKNKKKVDPNFESEIILLDAEILRCYELKIIKNKHGTFFAMSCMVAKCSTSMEMKVSSLVLNELLQTTPDEWLTLSYDDQMKKYEMCTKELIEMFVPLVILINPKVTKKGKYNEYFILTKELDFL